MKPITDDWQRYADFWNGVRLEFLVVSSLLIASNLSATAAFVWAALRLVSKK